MSSRSNFSAKRGRGGKIDGTDPQVVSLIKQQRRAVLLKLVPRNMEVSHAYPALASGCPRNYRDPALDDRHHRLLSFRIRSPVSVPRPPTTRRPRIGCFCRTGAPAWTTGSGNRPVYCHVYCPCDASGQSQGFYGGGFDIGVAGQMRLHRRQRHIHPTDLHHGVEATARAEAFFVVSQAILERGGQSGPIGQTPAHPAFIAETPPRKRPEGCIGTHQSGCATTMSPGPNPAASPPGELPRPSTTGTPRRSGSSTVNRKPWIWWAGTTPTTRWTRGHSRTR